MPNYGMDATIGISFQNSYGTSNVASMHWLEPISESVDLKKAQLMVKGMQGGRYDEGVSQEGANTVDGDISIEAKGIPLGALFEAVMGRTTVTSTGVYTHTFKPRTADHQAGCAERPFTYHKHLGDSTGSAHLYADLNGNTLEIAAANGELLTSKLGVVGGTYSQSAKSTATYYTGSALPWNVASASLNGTAKTNVRQLSLSLNNNLEAKSVISNARFPSRIKRGGPRQISVSGTLAFDDQVEAQLFMAQSEQRLTVSFVTSTQIQSGYYESMTIDVPSLRFTEFPLAVGGAGEIEVSFKGVAKYNTGSATALAVTLVNSKAGY